MPDTYHPNVLLLATALTGSDIQVSRISRKAAEQLRQTARKHGVMTLFHWCAQEGNVHGLTEADRDALNTTTRAQVIHDLLLNADTNKTLDLLASADIPALLLKGTPVAFRYYKDTYLRTRCDTDLFIRTEDIQATAEVLSTNGYQISGLGQRTNASKQFCAIRSTCRGLGATFDIHWRLSNRILFNHILRFEECWTARQPLPELGSNAYTLSPAQLLLHACIHRIAHGRNTERNRLLWLYDIHLITSRFSDEAFGQFQQLAIEKQVGTLCRDALVMSQYYFRTTYPERYLSGLARNHRREPTARLLQASKLRWAFADLIALKTLREQLAFAGELLSPPSLAEQNRILPRMRSWTAHLRSKIGWR